MDAFSVSAGVAGFLSLTIELSKPLYQFASNAKNASDDAKKLYEEVVLVSVTLRDLKDLLDRESAGNSMPISPVLLEALKMCSARVEEIYQVLVPNVEKTTIASLPLLSAAAATATTVPVLSASRFEAMAKKLKQMGSRVAWPFGKADCEKAVEALSRCVQCINFFLATLNRYVWYTVVV